MCINRRRETNPTEYFQNCQYTDNKNYKQILNSRYKGFSLQWYEFTVLELLPPITTLNK